MRKFIIFLLIALMFGCTPKSEDTVEIPKYDDVVIKASWFSFVDYRDNMQNMSEDVVRNQERDFHKDAIEMLKTLGLRYYGKYNVIPQGAEW